MEAYERTTKSRARILAPKNRIEVLETIRAQGEPADTPDLYLVIVIETNGTDRPLGSAGNLAGALQLCALEVGRQLVTLEAAQGAQAAPAAADTHQAEGTPDPLLAALLARMDTKITH